MAGEAAALAPHDTGTGPRPRWDSLRPWLLPVLVVTLLGLMLHLLQEEMAHLRYHDIVVAVREVPARQIGWAFLCTILSYSVLPGYDLLALAYVERRLPVWRVVSGSVAAYGVSQTLGFPSVTGASVRVRLWSAWGLDTGEIARAVAFSGGTFSLGVLALTGIAGLVEPATQLERLHLPVAAVRAFSGVFLTTALAYVVGTLAAPGHRFRVREVEIALPSRRLLAGQLLVAAVDWLVASLVLFVLLPPAHGVHFPAFLAAFLLAQSAGLISHVPGGLGVFETLIVLQVGSTMPLDRLLASLLAYRLVFYLVPFAGAVAILATHELRRQHARLARSARVLALGFERWAEPLLPTTIGTMTILGGAMLLVSGATPAIRGRMTVLVDALPLGIVELSHFAGSVVGAALLVLGWALTRRLDAAYHLARVLLLTAIAASLFKGLDYEEAMVLVTILGVLVASRDAFYRKATLLAEPLTAGWIASIVAIIAASIWIGVFSFRHVDYDHDLWWRFAERGDAPRFLRASAGAAALLLTFGTMRLLRPAAPVLSIPSPSDLEAAARIVANTADTSAALALLGDKHLLFDDDMSGFLMYGVQGRAWISLGDPCGPPDVQRELAWRFRESADAHGGSPVFYEVSAAQLPLCVDLGLTVHKMGEEAYVPLADFSLEGGARKGLRRTQRDVVKAGGRFEVLPANAVDGLLPRLREISDAWLTAKATREKGFSMGYFDPDYLRRFPLAVVRVADRIVAFANLWTGDGTELSVDLMRYDPSAPNGSMEYLFVELMLWGRANGFARMNLGMAPLSGLHDRPLAPAWQRLGAMLFRHGEHFYNFQGLRRYKEKFDPVWEPRYLATPPGLALPRILTNLASLVSGGVTGIFRR